MAEQSFSGYIVQLGRKAAASFAYAVPIWGKTPTGKNFAVGVSEPVAATVTLTFAANATSTDPFQLGGVNYRVMTTPAQAYDIQLGGSAAITLDNIKSAVIADGTAGAYFAGTKPNQAFTATTNTNTTQLFVALVPGADGNTLTATETFTDAGNVFSSVTGGTSAALKVDTSAAALPAGTANIGDVDIETFENSADVTMQAAATGTGNGTVLTVTGYGTASLQVTGTFTGTITFEGTQNGTDFVEVSATRMGTSTIASTATVPGVYRLSVAGLTSIRARVSAYTSGSITVSGRATNAPYSGKIVNVGTLASVGYSASATFTPGNTAHGAADTNGTAGTFTTMGPSAGRIMITSVSLEIDGAAAEATAWRVYLYNVTPPSALADDSVFDLPSGDRASYLGYIDLGTAVDLGSTQWVEASGVNKQLKLSGTNLFGYLVNLTALTPPASTAHIVTLHAVAV